MAIQVYEDASKPGYYIAWDGQHTAISLYIILTKVFGERTAQTMIPVVVYNVKHKLEIRRNFILLNGDAKEELDFIDKYKQMETLLTSISRWYTALKLTEQTTLNGLTQLRRTTTLPQQACLLHTVSLAMKTNQVHLVCWLTHL